ncbi:MAG: ferrous iron transport protein A [Erythrobacter sp.]|nr:ferrous iron transport protein A [Erythrobacter sp.]
MTLDTLRHGSPARIVAIAWETLASDEAKRLRALGLDEGAEIEVLHRGVFGGRDPIAVRLGRMTVALRRSHAAAIKVETIEAGATP